MILGIVSNLLSSISAVSLGSQHFPTTAVTMIAVDYVSEICHCLITFVHWGMEQLWVIIIDAANSWPEVFREGEVSSLTLQSSENQVYNQETTLSHSTSLFSHDYDAAHTADRPSKFVARLGKRSSAFTTG